MASLNEEIKVEEVNLGGYDGIAESAELPVKAGFWSRMKAFWFQEIDWNAKIDWNREIKVELTPYQQKVEDEVNEFLHQDVGKLLFKKIKF